MGNVLVDLYLLSGLFEDHFIVYTLVCACCSLKRILKRKKNTSLQGHIINKCLEEGERIRRNIHVRTFSFVNFFLVVFHDLSSQVKLHVHVSLSFEI